MKTGLPLVLELADAKLIAGDVDIQLSSKTSTRQSLASCPTSPPTSRSTTSSPDLHGPLVG